MPIYEFACGNCHRKFRKLVGVVANARPLQCPHCQSADAKRLMSRFARVRSEDDALDAMADDIEGLDESDPRAMRRLMRDMSQEMGEDVGDDFEQMLDAEEAGTASDEDSSGF